MKYIKSDHPLEMPDMKSIVMFVEGPLGIEVSVGLKAIDDSFIVSGADFISLYPYRTYGMICTGDRVDALEVIKKQEILIHPVAFQAYISLGVIDEDGNYIESDETPEDVNPEDIGFSSN